MNAPELLRNSLKTAHEWFEATVADVTPEMAHWRPAGQAHPIGSLYAHTVAVEDMLVNAKLKGGVPLYAAAWAGKAGLSDPQNAVDRTLDWAQSVQVDVSALRAYAQAVYAATDEYLGSLNEEALGSPIDLPEWGISAMPLGAFLADFVLGHVHDLMGEISCLKGLQGAKGYPF